MNIWMSVEVIPPQGLVLMGMLQWVWHWYKEHMHDQEQREAECNRVHHYTVIRYR